MRHNLIATLTQLQHLSPDDIVNHMSDRGWIQGKDFTLERMERWKNRQTRVWIRTFADSPVSSGDCGLHNFAWDLVGLNHSLPKYWFILEEHFNGEYPSC